MKRLSIVLLIVVLLFSFCVPSFATENPAVYSDEVGIVPNEVIEVPIKLKNNPGLMGFKITVNYLPDVIDVVSVKVGDLIKTGSFNSNFGLSDTHFDVIWNSTENVKGDGTLFVIEVKTKQNFKDKAEISLTYSQGDTFNEMWEDVKLDCKKITVKKSVEEKTEVITEESTVAKSEEISALIPTSQQILSAIDEAMKEKKFSSVYEAGKSPGFIDAVNKNISKAVGDKENQIWIL